MEYYSAIKNNKRVPFAATWMDLEINTQSEINQRQILYYITYMWNLKSDTNELISKAEIDSQTENKLMVTKGEWGGGINLEFGINYCI